MSMWPNCGLPLNLNAIRIFYKEMHAASDDDDFEDDHEHDDSDIYIMMKCLSVCVSRKMSTSSWESPVTT